MSPIPEHELRQLVEAVVGDTRASRRPWQLSPTEKTQLEALKRRRENGEPLQHITGKAYFRYETVAVGPGVFIPRPETEVMTGWALEQIKAKSLRNVVELCAGSGAISMALHRETPAGTNLWAVEKSEDAFIWTSRNLQDCAVNLVCADMVQALPELNAQVDLIICNPPYIPLEVWEDIPAEVKDYDPFMALFSGNDGLDAMRVLAQTAKRLLKPQGLLCAEHAEVQHDLVTELFLQQGFENVCDHKDLTDRWRFVTASWPG